MPNEVILRAFTTSDGGIQFDVFLDPKDAELPEDADDGGLCSSGMHADNCKSSDCDGCPEAMAKPYQPADWRNALDMAVDQAIDLIARDAAKPIE